MVINEEQERVKTLLTDTITLLCRNGLTFKSEFNISALIGITLDKDSVFLIDIRETIKASELKDDIDVEDNKDKNHMWYGNSADLPVQTHMDTDEENSDLSQEIKKEIISSDNEDYIEDCKNEPSSSSSIDDTSIKNIALDAMKNLSSQKDNNDIPRLYPPPFSSSGTYILPTEMNFNYTPPQDNLLNTKAQDGRPKRVIRRMCTLAERYAAIKDVEARVASKSAIARKYGIPQNTLSTWIKNADKIKDGFEMANFRPNILKMRLANHPDIERDLNKWVQCATLNGDPISGQILQDKAQEIAKNLGHENFVCTQSWVCRFKNRYGLRFRDMQVTSSSLNNMQPHVDLENSSDNFLDDSIPSFESKTLGDSHENHCSQSLGNPVFPTNQDPTETIASSETNSETAENNSEIKKE